MKEGGVETLVSLLTEDEVFWLGLAEEGRLAKKLGLQFLSHPIPDAHVSTRSCRFPELRKRPGQSASRRRTTRACIAGKHWPVDGDRGLHTDPPGLATEVGLESDSGGARLPGARYRRAEGMDSALQGQAVRAALLDESFPHRWQAEILLVRPLNPAAAPFRLSKQGGGSGARRTGSADPARATARGGLPRYLCSGLPRPRRSPPASGLRHIRTGFCAVSGRLCLPDRHDSAGNASP